MYFLFFQGCSGSNVNKITIYNLISTLLNFRLDRILLFKGISEAKRIAAKRKKKVRHDA
jgi:hypothetical protein